MAQGLTELRHEPTEKRVRATLGASTVVDSGRALLVWEPRRVVPSYAVPVGDVRGELLPAAPYRGPKVEGILHPGVPFRLHSSAGRPISIRSDGVIAEAAAFRPVDPDLDGYLVLDFAAFDAWYEEDERLAGHPRDPYHRVDIRPSSRHVRVERDGMVLAESDRPVLVFETGLPVRFYLPRADVAAELEPSARRTTCAYKGEASYWSVRRSAELITDLAWSYPEPLPDAGVLTDLVAFFDDHVDLTVDGMPRERPRGAIAAAILDEAGVG